ncbi:hypothetical protein [Sinomonas sp.]|uniref:hypothetical protein n=1 Tax=Sinomonas sp. TaxID=1914986 RepID=UPI003F7DF330
MRELSNGTTVSLKPSKDGPLVVLDHPDAPDDMRNIEAGRIILGSYQPKPFCEFGLRSETLRAIADLIEARVVETR